MPRNMRVTASVALAWIDAHRCIHQCGHGVEQHVPQVLRDLMALARRHLAVDRDLESKPSERVTFRRFNVRLRAMLLILGKVLAVCAEVVVQDLARRVDVRNDRVEQQAAQCLVAAAFHR